MSARSAIIVLEDGLSTGWRETARMVGSSSDRKEFHTVTMIEDPTIEDATIRSGVDRLLAHLGWSGVETVANTVFPQAMAASSSSAAALADRYRAIYPRIRKLHPDNRRGTYFGRMVAFPDGTSTFDQLAKVIDRLNVQGALRGPMGAAYEMAVHAPEDLGEHVDVYSAPNDRVYRGFPCLSSLSFQRDRTHLYLLAQYRYEFLVAKGYGNYLGLARLQTFVAEQVGLATGRLTVVTGRAHLDVAKGRVGRFVDGLPI